MAPSADDTSPPWRLGAPHDTLNRLTLLLGTFVLKESDVNEQSFAEKALVPKHDTLLKLLWNDVTNDSPFSFPCLSLVTEDHATVDGAERNEVQAKAALSMAQTLTPVLMTEKAGNEHVSQNSISEAADKCHCSALTWNDVPTAMINNLAASFALLVDARLRAYTTILARHGVALASAPQVEHEAIAAVERKLESLVDIGSRISIDNMVTTFQPQSKLAMSRCVDNGGVVEIVMPLIMTAVLDTTIPKECEGQERVTVTLQAAGAIVGTFSCRDAFVIVVVMQSNLAFPFASFRVE